MNEELIAEAELGEEARQFLDGNLGKYLIGLAEQEVWMAQKALGTVDPRDATAIMDLQNHIKVATWFQKWLEDLVDKGDSALEAFKQQQQEA
jgi:hypothetical protein